MADDQNASRVFANGFFERSHGVHVEVVVGFVEQHHVGRVTQQSSQVHAVALTT